MTPDQFRRLGHELVDQVAEFLQSWDGRPVTPGESPAQVRALLGDITFTEHGEDESTVLQSAWRLLVEHSLLNGHPRFGGYVTSSPAPIGCLADLMASALNPNVGAWILAPIATEIELQTIRWIAEFIGYPSSAGGLLVSGGNMANFVGFLAARRAKAGPGIRSAGVASGGRLLAYTSQETHTWIQKATDLFGLGTDAIRWIPCDARCRIDLAALRQTIEHDLAAGGRPFFLSASAGTVSTGAVDPLPDLAEIARAYDLWFHVDGAYGGPAAALPDASADLKGLSLADSVALDPHKWLYAPVEAGCTLVRNPAALRDTFDYSPAYYHFEADAEEAPLNFYATGPQNSRGFRALKVWMALRAAGREGMRRMIADDIALARALYRKVQGHDELEALTHGLSITTFRYVPRGVDRADPYLNQLNEQLLERIQKSGELFLSNALINGTFALRMCIVNFRTAMADIRAIPEIVIRLGREVHTRSGPAAS